MAYYNPVTDSVESVTGSEFPQFAEYDEPSRKIFCKFYLLHREGGVVSLLDTNLRARWNTFRSSGKHMWVDATTFAMLPNTEVSRLCISCIESMIASHSVRIEISWTFMERYIVDLVLSTFPSYIYSEGISMD